MPDPAKFKALKTAGFKIQPTCGRCGYFAEGANQWGTCRVITYKHEKHTGEERFASVPTDGYCPKFIRCESEVVKLGSHIEFLSVE